MSEFEWSILVIFLIVVSSVGSFIAARLMKLHSAKLAHGQTQLNKKTGVTPTPTPASPGTPPANPPATKGWFAKYSWIIWVVLILVGAIALVAWKLQGTPGSLSQSLKAPSLNTVWAFTQDYWLWILLFCGFVFGFTFFVSKEEKAGLRAFLQVTPVFVVVGMFMILPVLAWITSPSSPSTERATRSESRVPLASSPQSEWPKLVIPAKGKSKNVAVPSGMHIVLAGNQFILHTVYLSGRECTSKERCPDGPITGTYLTNESGTMNIVSYSFAPNR